MNKLVLISAVVLSFTLINCSKDNKTEQTADCNENLKYADIAPIIANNCALAGCHAINSTNGSLTTFQEVKNIIENGKMDTRVLSNFATMPPGGFADPNDKEKIRCWVDNNYPEN